MTTEILSSSVESICAFSLFAPAPAPQNDGVCENCGSTILLGRKAHHLTWCTPANVVPFVPEPEAPAPVAEPVAVNVAPLSAMQRQQVENIADGGRNDVIKAIKTALQRRSGKQWSVTGGRGTAWGWIKIEAPPARRTWGSRPLPHNEGGHLPGVENWEPYDTGEPDRNMSPSDRAELGKLLGLDRDAYRDGESVASSHDYYRVYICRALHGHAGPFTAEQYWD